MGILWKDLMLRDRDNEKSYNSPILKMYNQGGLLFVSPPFIHWAKLVMEEIRNLITKIQITKLGSKAKLKAFSKVVKDTYLKSLFDEVVRRFYLVKDLSEYMVSMLYRHVINFTYHAHSEYEWKKFCPLNTDRVLDGSKKLGQCE